MPSGLARVFGEGEVADQEEVEQLVRKLANAPTRGLELAKRAIRGAQFTTLDEQLDIERDSQRACGLTDDYREGVTAFKEKRPARFTGH